jgi:23S rRNA (adenine2503-C2)-methyltransferase
MLEVENNPVLSALDALSLPPPVGRANLLGATLDELQRFAVAAGEPRFRGEQIFSGLYLHRAADFAKLSTLPKRLRAQLEDVFTLERPRIDSRQVSTDGTRKYRFVAADGLAFEAVYIPEVARGSKTNTLCISSQTGCAVGCKFCFTASLKRNRNLAAGEIVGQVMAVQDDVKSLGDAARLTNIVFMGMGEPLLNYKEVVRAARLLVDPKALGFSTRRVTISTSGIVPRIYELGKDLPTQLAISLNATTDEVRTRIMPINKKWPIGELLAALRAFPLAPRRRITIEYVMLKDVNDSLDDARRLPKLLAGIPVKVNLLPLNVHDRTELDTPDPAQVARFQETLHAAGVNALVRTPRGRDISAACGQLGETVLDGVTSIQTPRPS